MQSILIINNACYFIIYFSRVLRNIHYLLIKINLVHAFILLILRFINTCIVEDIIIN